MTDYFKNIYRIDSARLKGWDYSSDGYYFVTINTQGEVCYFGDIINNQMVLSEIGKMAYKFWLDIPRHFPFIRLDEFIVMPNHIHGIIEIDKSLASTDSISCVRINRATRINAEQLGGVTTKNNPMLNKFSLAKVIRWYKGRCSYEINKIRDLNFFWQPRFYDHIIQCNKELDIIREYIISNPTKWDQNRYFKHNP